VRYRTIADEAAKEQEQDFRFVPWRCIRMTSSFDEQIPLTEGETVNNLKFRVICVYFKEQCSILSI